MKIVFMGTPDFAVPSLAALCDAGYDVIGVYTQPDRPKGRGNKLTPSPVKEEALRRGIPVYQPQRIRKESVEELKALAPDLCVTAAFGQILSQELLDIPPLGNVNVHASLLPRHRGSAPIAWGILQGDEKAGITTMLMDRGVDTGAMLMQKSVDILPQESCGELTERLSHVGAELLLETLRALEAGILQPIPQDESQMTYDPKLTKEMGVIDWQKDASDIVHQIHGLNPWPAATTPWEQGRLKLLKAEAAEGSGTPGEILQADAKAGLVIACGKNALRVLQLQAPGGKPMNSKDYLRGHPMTVGTVLKEENA